MNEEEFEEVDSIEDLEPAAKRFVRNELDVERFVDRLEGRDGRLRPSKPNAQSDDDLVRYIWRIARFHSGDDPSMPVTAQWDLENYLENESDRDYPELLRESRIGTGETIDLRNKDGKQIVGICHAVAKVCVMELNGDPNGGLKRWKKALYGE